MTGGTGLISGPVVRLLLAREHAVTIFHRGSTPLVAARSGNVAELIGDRSDHPNFVAALQSKGRWDCVIDVIGGCEADAQSLVEAVRGRTSHVVVCSTTSVYARPFERVPVTEDALCAPTFPYGQNKLAYEGRLRALAGGGDFALTIMRPAHTYGEASRVVHSLGNRTTHLDRIARGRPVIIHDDGQGLWSCAWTDDVASAFVTAVGNPRCFGKTYHLAGPEKFTWDRYHQTLAIALGAPPPAILHVPAETLARLAPDRTAQCLRTLRFPGNYDCSAAVRDLDYRPRVTLAEGFVRNVKHLRANGLIESWENDSEYEDLVNKINRESHK